ncbi:MAG: hypothetical protein ACFE0I_23975 [Elainellaceae cyanobacterium]
MVRIDPASQGCGYKKQLIPTALEFIQQRFPTDVDTDADTVEYERSHSLPERHREIQTCLLRWFCAEPAPSERFQSATAGLCLRCYVTYPILNACKQLASLFSASRQFTYRDLLPFVLNDDGKTQILLDPDNQTQHVLASDGKTRPSKYRFFTVEVLRKFDIHAESASTLETWAYYQTKQNQELKNFLSEQGFGLLSNWALLNRVGPKQLDTFSPRDRYIIESFHAVYRRDRRRNAQHRGRKCSEPSANQLREMQQWLREQGISISTLEEISRELHRLAQLLRRYDIWSRSGTPVSEPLNGLHPDINREFADPNSVNSLEAIAQQELEDFCRHQLIACLDEAIAEGLQTYINGLQRRRYASFVPLIVPALQLFYGEGRSQGEIASTLGFKNQVQVSRVLNLQKLLSQIRGQTITRLFQILSQVIHQGRLASISTNPEYASNLLHQLELFADAEVFQSAAVEIRTTKNRVIDSVYAQRLRQHLDVDQEVTPC